MKLTKEQKEELQFKIDRYGDWVFQHTNVVPGDENDDKIESIIKFIENLEPNSKEEICFSCGGTGIYKHEDIEVESKYSSQERQEKEECKHDWIKYDKETCLIPFDLCIYCTATRRAEPERIEEIDYDANQLYGSALKDIINQLIKAVNKLNNN